MAKKRTKKQKKQAEEKRKIEYTLSDSGVSVAGDQKSGRKQVDTGKKATTPMRKKRVESSFGAEITQLLYQDLRKTGIVTAVVFCILFGIYVYAG